ncbi:hypothetical protein V5799_019179 [Amblyomma americanum]|uniref:Uncharacterized protein n=1 Tax=Amblyomma americanum TaxID=6943 RepID=A0AAQ4EXM6_AMBAM
MFKWRKLDLTWHCASQKPRRYSSNPLCMCFFPQFVDVLGVTESASHCLKTPAMRTPNDTTSRFEYPAFNLYPNRNGLRKKDSSVSPMGGASHASFFFLGGGGGHQKCFVSFMYGVSVLVKPLHYTVS